jgi:hypothetical protein
VNHPGGAPVLSAVHSRSPMAPRAPSAPRAPAASLTTVDLRAELKHRYSGEDDCHCERHHNLDGDFGAVDTTPVRQAARTLTSLGSGGCCMVLALHLRMVVWPYKF